jgi:HSF-type DNA-binding
MSQGMTQMLPFSPTVQQQASGGSSGGALGQDTPRMNVNLPIASLPYIERLQPAHGIHPSDDLGGFGLAEFVGKPPATAKAASSQMQRNTVPQSDRVDIDMNLPFPVKLHGILSNPKLQEYVEWAPHGRAWKVLNPKAFESDVIPFFFRSDKYSSFMRQVRHSSLFTRDFRVTLCNEGSDVVKEVHAILTRSSTCALQVNGWAFSRITDGPDTNAYWHPLFLRGLPALASKMRRPPKTKNSAAAARATVGGKTTESPNFYRISDIAPLPAATPSFAAIPKSEHGTMDDPVDPFIDAAQLRMITWGTPQPLERNPFEDDSSPETIGEKVGSKSIDGDGIKIKPDEMTASQKQESTRLSDVDLDYLAHQNRLLLLYASLTKP